MIRRYPVSDRELDARIAAKRDTRETYGEFGAIVYVYRIALERDSYTNVKGSNQGKLWHPVDTPEEAQYWLEYYRERTRVRGFDRKPLYESAVFVPRGGR